MAITVAPATDDDGSLYGKDASDLQSGIEINNGVISGTLKYISDYSAAFSGDEASGHYIALKFAADGAESITVQVIGGLHGPSTLDEDGIVVARITSVSQQLKVVATESGISTTTFYSLNGLILE